jgi:ribonuclease VapC
VRRTTVVIDTSAFIAALAEADGPAYMEAIESAARPRASAFTVYEARIVLSPLGRAKHRFRAGTLETFLGLLDDLRVEIMPFGPRQVVLAYEAYRRFGKGPHPAALNLADCAAYALARELGEPLLFKGNDFGRTDVEVAAPGSWPGSGEG